MRSGLTIVRATILPATILTCLVPTLAQEASSGPVVLEPVVVSASRLPSADPVAPFSTAEIGRQTLERAPALSLDDLLRDEIPGFSLFRRSSSRIAHPTTQGVSLRNLGPNGAGRTLVLLDGVPLNEPFAGWVPWQRVPPASLDRVLVTRGGGAGLFGNAALAGTIHLEPLRPQVTSAALAARAGNRDTYEASVEGAVVEGPVAISLFAHRFSSGGYPVLQGGQRGPVDRNATVDADLLQGRVEWRLAEDATLAFSASAFDEERGNGTRLTRNATEGVDLSAALTRTIPTRDAEFRLVGFYQEREFSSLFTSVGDSRASESPALDQFSVPSRSAGGSATWGQALGADHSLVLGADLRWVEGETNERFFLSDGRFLRSRTAGGQQLFAGAFLEDTWQLTPAVSLVAGGRLDYVRQSDGTRIERDRPTGTHLLDETFSDTDSLEPNGRLGLHADLTGTLAARGALYTGFRQPTLNEFYRPFRVGNDITEANPALESERLLGLEAGLDWDPAPAFSAALTLFHNQLRDAVGNVTLAQGPGTFEVGGFVPPGGVLRQRQNLDRIDVSGIETSVRWAPADAWSLDLGYLFSHSEVAEARNARDLEGKRLAQAPEHVAVLGLRYRPAERWEARLQIRYVGDQFEDDQNRLRLAPYATVGLGLTYVPTDRLTLDLKVENLFDTEIETGKRADGLVSIGEPRLVSLGFRYEF